MVIQMMMTGIMTTDAFYNAGTFAELFRSMLPLTFSISMRLCIHDEALYARHK